MSIVKDGNYRLNLLGFVCRILEKLVLVLNLKFLTFILIFTFYISKAVSILRRKLEIINIIFVRLSM